jgi:hypothetical protein
VDWNGAIYNFATVIPSLSSLGTSGSWCAAGDSMGIDLCENGLFGLAGFGALPESMSMDLFAAADGTYTVMETAVGTPEPGSLAVMFAGLAGLLLLSRRRITQGLHQAA